MPRFILLPWTGSATDAPVFATALAVARRFSSHLAFLYVHPDVRQEFAALAASEVGAVSGIGDTMDQMERQADERARTAERQWRALCGQEDLAVRDEPPFDGISTEWIGEVGTDAAWVVEHGRTADLIVAGRGPGDSSSALVVLEAALLNSGRPVLIAPPAAPASVGRVVTIAWNGTREAAGAVSAAMPFIAQAERVVILTVNEDDETEDRSAERLQHALRWQSPAVLKHRLVREQGSAAETLLDAVTRAKSDLLVMGGYGHTRLREAVFGGFTRHVLQHADLPVLMTH